MSITRAMLKGYNLDENVQTAILDAHLETVNALKSEIDKYKGDAANLPEVQKQLDDANAKLKAADSDGYKAKYEAEKAAHDKLKEDTATAKTRAAKESALREALKAAGYSESGIKKIVKYGGFIDSVKLDDDGKFTNSEEVMKSAADEWSEYKGTTKTESAQPANPPTSGNEKKLDADVMEAQKLFAELHAAQYGEIKQPTKEG